MRLQVTDISQAEIETLHRPHQIHNERRTISCTYTCRRTQPVSDKGMDQSTLKVYHWKVHGDLKGLYPSTGLRKLGGTVYMRTVPWYSTSVAGHVEVTHE